MFIVMHTSHIVGFCSNSMEQSLLRS